MALEFASNFPVWALVVLAIVQVWDLCWKGIGLWKSGRNNHLTWFVAILIFNTIGILPLIYILWFDKKLKITKQVQKNSKKKNKKIDEDSFF